MDPPPPMVHLGKKIAEKVFDGFPKLANQKNFGKSMML